MVRQDILALLLISGGKHSVFHRLVQSKVLWMFFTLEKAMAPHSSTLAWKIPWTEEPGRLQSMGLEESDTTERLHFHFSLSCIGEGIGNPLQCSCLENPTDGGAWWAAICRVTQSQTRLKRLSSSSNTSGTKRERWLPNPVVTRAKKGRKSSTL